MTQQTINRPFDPKMGPNLGDSSERGDSWDATLAKVNSMMTELYALSQQRSDRAALVGNTQFTLPDNIIDDTTSNSLNSRKLCYAPTSSAITDIVLGFPGFGNNIPEADFPVTYTVKASVEYPIGTTPQQVFFAGATSVAVAPGRVIQRSDPLPIHIPAGAQFAVKCYVTWIAGHFWLTTLSAAQLVGEWTTRGTGVADNTLNTTVLTTTSNVAGFAPIVYGTLATKTAVVGMIGDSIGNMTADWVDTNVGHNCWGRALRNVLPFVSLSRGSDTYALYFQRLEGRNLVLRSSVATLGISHMIMQLGFNDLWGGASLSTMQTNLQQACNPFLDRGVKCYAPTFLPKTTSSDGWITAANQTTVSAPQEAIRVAYNSWLRQNYASLGLSGVIDMARAIDPTDSGKFSFDQTPTSIGHDGAGVATLTNGGVSAVNNWTYNSNASIGSSYPNAVNIPCVVNNYPGTPGSGAVVRAVTNGSGQVTSFIVDSPGSGYTYPPMVTPRGVFTSDGVHLTTRGVQEMIVKTGLSPSLFTFP